MFILLTVLVQLGKLTVPVIKEFLQGVRVKPMARKGDLVDQLVAYLNSH